MTLKAQTCHVLVHPGKGWIETAVLYDDLHQHLYYRLENYVMINANAGVFSVINRR